MYHFGGSFDIQKVRYMSSSQIFTTQPVQIFAFEGNMISKNLALRALDINSNIISGCGTCILRSFSLSVVSSSNS